MTWLPITTTAARLLNQDSCINSLCIPGLDLRHCVKHLLQFLGGAVLLLAAVSAASTAAANAAGSAAGSPVGGTAGSNAVLNQSEGNMTGNITATEFAQTDPEFAALWQRFTAKDVALQNDLPDATRYLAILATLIGSQAVDEFKAQLPVALEHGVTPVAVKETIYQATAYLGVGRIRPFLTATNEILSAHGISLPLAPQGTTTDESRLLAGNNAQIKIFGTGMKGFYESGPEESRHINYWLADNCFGDFYTRTGLDLNQREMITFCFLTALGGCEPQLKSHISGNFNLGNGKAFLLKVLSQCLPYNGYPRTLNALRCLNEVSSAQ